MITQLVNKGHIKSYHGQYYDMIAQKQGNENPQNNIIAFLSPQQENVTQCSNHLPQRAAILTQRSNLTPQRAKNTVNDLLVVPKMLST